MTKCNKCLFAKDIDKDSCKCLNSISDWYESRLFLKWDGCNYGKSSVIGMSKSELLRLAIELKQSEVKE